MWEPAPYVVNGSLGASKNRTADEAQAVFLEKWVGQNFAGTDAGTAAAIADLWTR